MMGRVFISSRALIDLQNSSEDELSIGYLIQGSHGLDTWTSFGLFRKEQQEEE